MTDTPVPQQDNLDSTDEINYNVAEPEKKKGVIAGIRSVRDVLNDKPVDCIQPGLLCEGSVTMLVGDPGAGKTVFALKLVDAIANGRSFLGHQHIPRPVAYLDRDGNALVDVAKRMEWLQIEDGGYLKYFGSNVPEFDVPGAGSQPVVDWVNELDIRPVILLDSYSHFLDGGDENSTKDVNKLWAEIRPLKRAGVSFIILHHLGKGEDARKFLRGSTAIQAGVDYAFRVSNKTPNVGSGTQIVVRKIGKPGVTRLGAYLASQRD